MMETVVDALSWTLLVAGGAFVFIGGLGAPGLPSYHPHDAASLTDTMGMIPYFCRNNATSRIVTRHR